MDELKEFASFMLVVVFCFCLISITVSISKLADSAAERLSERCSDNARQETTN